MAKSSRKISDFKMERNNLYKLLLEQNQVLRDFVQIHTIELILLALVRNFRQLGEVNLELDLFY